MKLGNKVQSIAVLLLHYWTLHQGESSCVSSCYQTVKRTSHSEGSQTASPQCVTSGVSSGHQTAKRTFHIENICIAFPRCESIYVSSGDQTLKRTFHTVDSHIPTLHCE